MGSQTYLRAFNRAVRARNQDADDVVAPLVALGRDVARQLDSGLSEAGLVRQIGFFRVILNELRKAARTIASSADSDRTNS